MRKLLVLLTGLAAVASLHAQTTGIAGNVIDAATRAPIQGATVCCYVANAQTDSLGNYLIPGLAPGKYRVRAIKTGYDIAYYPESVLVVHGQVTEHIDFALVRTGAQRGSISGRVTDSRTGQTIAGAEVAASGPHGSRAVIQCTSGYRIDSLPPGRYRVSASANGYEPGCYPESIAVVAGQNTGGICFQLTPAGGQTGGISGWVFDAQTRLPIVGATVCCGAGNARTNEQGYYIIDALEPRNYLVRAMAQGYVTGVYPESVAVVAGRTSENINFHLEPSGQPYGGIAGRVTSAGNGELLTGAVVRAASPHLSRAVTQCSTGYRFCELPAGKYWVTATCRGFQPGHYPESVLVVGGQVTDGISFQLEPTGVGYGGISGFVTNARTHEPIMGALVVAEGPSRGHANTCQRGGYAIRELLPGRYVVEATARGFEPSRLAEVEVVAGQMTPEVNFALEPLAGGTGAIMGRVRDSLTNVGVNDATLFAWGDAGQGSTLSESCGGYIIRELRAGPYRVRACKPGYYHKLFPDTVFVAAGETTAGIDFLLTPVQGPAGGISGFVFNGLAQTEISGATVLAIGETGSWQVTSDIHGDYLIDGLESGEYLLQVEALGYSPGTYPDPVPVEAGVVAAFVSPALYPLTGAAEQHVPAAPLLAASPNPFRASTNIRFAPETRAAELVIFDRSGRLVRTLAVRAGMSSVEWDGRDHARAPVCEGVYFCRLGADPARSQKLILLNR